MAARALAAAVTGRRVVGFPALASSRRGGGAQAQQSNSSRHSSSAHTQAEEQRSADHDTAAQVEAALNTKNVEEVVAQDLGVRAATTVLPDELEEHDADSAWVPDQDTGVFVPAEEAAASDSTHDDDAPTAPSVLDQTVFNREEEMEDVERPAVDMMANGGAGAN